MDGNCQGLIRLLPESLGPGVPPPHLTGLLDYQGPFPLWIVRLHHFLCLYPTPQLTSYLVQGLTSGFRIGFNRTSPLRSSCCNHPLSLEPPQIIDYHFSSEVQSGRLVGPLPASISSLVQSSPIGLMQRVTRPSGAWWWICHHHRGGASMMVSHLILVHCGMLQWTTL